MTEFQIDGRLVAPSAPTYFIADIAANHDGDLKRAVKLIYLAKEAGANAAKFQHFRASKIVSRHGFESLGKPASHQALWTKSVFEVYQSASVPWDWTPTLVDACREAQIAFMTTPYDLETVDMLDPFLSAYKIGSGDITWIQELEHIAKKGKAVLLATGASDLGDVQRAVSTIVRYNPRLLLMQCNTNYTGSPDNFRHVHLNVLRTYASMYPDTLLGLSDHTPGHAAVLGAVTLGARAIEKHFTDDCSREGPDHAFALDPPHWRDMVDRTRELEMALGAGNKVVELNEKETVVIQRRCVRATHCLAAGTVISESDLEVLRPAPADAIFPYDLANVLGKRVRRAIAHGDYLRWTDLAV